MSCSPTKFDVFIRGDNDRVVDAQVQMLNASSNSSYKFNFLPKKDFSILAVEQYGSNINYEEKPFSFYRKNQLSLKDGSLDNINFYLHKMKSEEVKKWKK